MIVREAVLDRFLAYLNREISLDELVAWAESILMDADFDPGDAQMLMTIVGYIGAVDSPGFELTWEVCTDFLNRLGTSVKVVPVAA